MRDSDVLVGAVGFADSRVSPMMSRIEFQSADVRVSFFNVLCCAGRIFSISVRCYVLYVVYAARMYSDFGISIKILMEAVGFLISRLPNAPHSCMMLQTDMYVLYPFNYCYQRNYESIHAAYNC